MNHSTSQSHSFGTLFRNLFYKPSGDYNIRIGRLLLEKHVITENQLYRALEFQQENIQQGRPIFLGQLLVELGYATEKEVVQVINDYYRLAITSLSENIESLVRKTRTPPKITFKSPRIPIWLQLSLAAMFLIIMTIFSLSAVILKQQEKQLYKQTVKIGKVSLNYFSNSAQVPLLEDSTVRLNKLINEAAEVEGIRYAIIVDNKQMIKAHTDTNKIDTPFDKFANVENLTREGDVYYFNYVSGAGEHLLNLTQAISFADKMLGEVHVGISIDFIEKLVHEKTISIIIITSIIIFFGVIFAVLLGIHFSRPVSILATATQEISKGNYQYRVNLSRNDELGHLARAFNHMSRELWTKSLMQKSFGKYVGTEVLKMIMADPESIWLKGQRNEATILFTDIRGFTAYSEDNEPENVVEGLNSYFEIASRSIISHGGYIDKFIGDAVLAVFGVPIYHENHMERALRAAVDMQANLKLSSRVENDFLGSIGISINSGVVVSGNIGSQSKMEYTVIGDSVNVASRMNGLAGPGEIIISKILRDGLRNMIEVEPLPPQMIKGKSEPIETFKLLSIKEKSTEYENE